MAERPILFSGGMIRAILAGTKSQTRRAVKPASDILTAEVMQRADLRLVDEGACGFVARWGSESYGPIRCPYGVPGDRLVVKEAAWMWCERRQNGKTKTGRPKWLYVPSRSVPVFYVADHPGKPSLVSVDPERCSAWDWRKKIGRFLPRWASRLTLEVVSVRVERVQDISEEDAIAEGLRAQLGDGGGPGSGYKWEGVGYEGSRPGYYHAPNRYERGCGCNVGGPTPAQCAYRDLWDSLNAKRGYGWDANPWVRVVEFKRVEQGAEVKHG